MSGFSKTDISFFRSQFARFDNDKSGSVGANSLMRLIEACWVVAGLHNRPQPRDVENAYQTHQQNDRINLSQFIMVGAVV